MTEFERGDVVQIKDSYPTGSVYMGGWGVKAGMVGIVLGVKIGSPFVAARFIGAKGSPGGICDHGPGAVYIRKHHLILLKRNEDE